MQLGKRVQLTNQSCWHNCVKLTHDNEIETVLLRVPIFKTSQHVWMTSAPEAAGGRSFTVAPMWRRLILISCLISGFTELLEQGSSCHKLIHVPNIKHRGRLHVIWSILWCSSIYNIWGIWKEERARYVRENKVWISDAWRDVSCAPGWRLDGMWRTRQMQLAEWAETRRGAAWQIEWSVLTRLATDSSVRHLFGCDRVLSSCC
jgi:hypothetical protein